MRPFARFVPERRPPRRPEEMSSVELRERLRDSPARARSLLTVRAAISSARLLRRALLALALLDVLVLAGALRALLHAGGWHGCSCRRLPLDLPGARLPFTAFARGVRGLRARTATAPRGDQRGAASPSSRCPCIRSSCPAWRCPPTRSATRTCSWRCTAAMSCTTAGCPASPTSGSGSRRCWRCAATSRRASRPRCARRSPGPRRRRPPMRWILHCARSPPPMTRPRVALYRARGDGGAAARVPRAPLRLPAQGGRSAFVGAAAPVRGAEGRARPDPGRRVRQRRSGAHACAAVRGRDGGARSGRPLRRVCRSPARQHPGDREPHVAVRTAPPLARSARRSPRPLRDGVLGARIGATPTGCGGSGSMRRERRVSSTSTSPPTRSTRTSPRSTLPAAWRASSPS